MQKIMINIAWVIGTFLCVAGIFLIIDDSMSGGWCPPSRGDCFNVEEYLNGYWLLAAGALLLIFPVIRAIKANVQRR